MKFICTSKTYDLVFATATRSQRWHPPRGPFGAFFLTSKRPSPPPLSIVRDPAQKHRWRRRISSGSLFGLENPFQKNEIRLGGGLPLQNANSQKYSKRRGLKVFRRMVCSVLGQFPISKQQAPFCPLQSYYLERHPCRFQFRFEDGIWVYCDSAMKRKKL